MILLQILVWVVGITLTVYIAGYQLFFSGAVDMIMAIIDMFNSGATKELATTAVWSFVKLWIASFIAWVLLMGTGAISAIVHEYAN